MSLTPLVVASGIFAHLFHTAYREKTIAHLEEMISKHREIVDSHLEERLSTIQTLLDICPLESLAKTEYLKDLLYILHSQYGRVFVDVGFVDDTGTLLAYAGPFQLGGATYAQSEWFKDAVANDHFISDVFLGLRNQPHFIVASSREVNGRRYVLRATIDFKAFTRLVEDIRIGKTGHAYIINRKGEFQTPPSKDITGVKEEILNFVQRILPQTPVAGSLLEVVEGLSFDTGEDTVFVLTTLKQGEWVMIYEQASEDAFTDMATARLIVFTVLALGSLGIIVMALLLTRRVVNYIAKLDEDKEKMNEQVIHASKMASLGEMAAGIAHEINNPVAIMMEEVGWIQDLIQDHDATATWNDDEIQSALKQVTTQGHRCKDITQKLLSFAHKTEPERFALDINNQIRETVDLVTSKARFSNVLIETTLSATPLHVNASTTEIQQVLLNIFNNSLDAMEPGGGKLTISTRAANKNIILEIRDTGCGIPESVLSKVFNPFFTTKPVGRGTGLGLAVCYGLIKNMGGDISVSSAVGQGTTFHITLPMAPASTVHSFHIGNMEGKGQ